MIKESALSPHSTLRQPVPFLDIPASIAPIKEQITNRINEIIEESSFIGGKYVTQFEENFARWVGEGSHAVGCGNGTDAITLAAKALKLPKGAVAIVPAMTYVATAAALEFAGVELKLVDVQPGTWLMDLEKLRSEITPDTKLIVPVHLYGQMPAMDQISKIADEHQCFVLEDAAQAQGARWQNKPVGFWGDIATFSFFPGKNLGAFGDAGGILSRESSWIEACRAMGNQGGLKKYDHYMVGCNSRLDHIQAAVLDLKLLLLEGWNERRREVASRYHEQLTGIGDLELTQVNSEALPVWHQYVVLTKDRQAMTEHLKNQGVSSGVHYPNAIHQLAAFSDRDFAKQSFPVAERLAKHCFSLPICPTLSDAEVDFVCEKVREYFA